MTPKPRLMLLLNRVPFNSVSNMRRLFGGRCGDPTYGDEAGAAARSGACAKATCWTPDGANAKAINARLLRNAVFNTQADIDKRALMAVKPSNGMVARTARALRRAGR